MTRILLLSGSTRDRSLHTSALRTADTFAPAGISTSLFQGLRTLPAFVPGEQDPPDVTELRSRVNAADALLFCTPEYAGSLPGSLKNLLDWLIEGGDLNGKPAAWLSVSPPEQDDGARTALETVLGHGSARVLKPACVRVPLGPEAVGADGLIADTRLHMALLDMLQALSRLLTVPPPQAAPSWQAMSSLYPMVLRRRNP